jgi:hypothetical protein
MSEDLFSQASGDNEASRGLKDKGSEISFVLERKSTESGGSPQKLGLFSIALVMCVCCLSQFFTPMGDGSASSTGGNP